MTNSNAAAPPSSPSTSRVPLRAWIILWTVVAAAVAALLAFNARLDSYLWCSTRWAVGDGEFYKWADYHQAHAGDSAPEFFMIKPPPMDSRFYRRTEPYWTMCKRCGEVWMTVIAIALIATFHRRRRLLAGAAIAGTSIAGFLGWLIRTLDGRYRPTHTDGANHWEIFRGFHNGTDLSFPSGHATLAFATAAALSYVFPRGRPLFIALATLTAISRVVQEAHFWSDTLFGAALGWSIAWFTMYYADKFLPPLPWRGFPVILKERNP